MDTDEARQVRGEVETTPGVRFHEYAFDETGEIVIVVLREIAGDRLRFDTLRAWNNYKGYLELQAEERQER